MSGPLFLGGCARSGTTLLEVLLERHPDVCIAFETLFPVLAARSAEEAARLVRAPSQVVAKKIHPQHGGAALPDGGTLSVAALERIVEGAPRTSWEALSGHVIRTLRGRTAARWGLKSTWIQFHADRTIGLFPDARMVLIVRDGRDVAASLKDLPRGIPQVDAAARWWVRCVRAGERAKSRYPQNVHLLRYEDLVADPDARLAEIARFADLSPFAPVTAQSEDELRGVVPVGAIAAGVGDRPIRERVGTHRERLTPMQIAIVEATAAETLDRWGYPLPDTLRSRSRRVVAKAVVDALYRPSWIVRHALSRWTRARRG